MSENTEVKAEVAQNEAVADLAARNAKLQKIASIGVRTAQTFLGLDLKIGESKREAIIKASKQFSLDDNEELNTFLDAYRGEYIAKKQSENTAAVRRSEAKVVLMTIKAKGVETVEKMGGEWNDFLNQVRLIVNNKPPATTPVNNNALDGKGADTPESKPSRNVGKKQVDNMAEQAKVLSIEQNYQVLNANIAALAEKPGFEVVLMQSAAAALAEIEERTKDEYWLGKASGLLTQINEILAHVKIAAAQAVMTTNQVKEDSKASETVAA